LNIKNAFFWTFKSFSAVVIILNIFTIFILQKLVRLTGLISNHKRRAVCLHLVFSQSVKSSRLAPSNHQKDSLVRALALILNADTRAEIKNIVSEKLITRRVPNATRIFIKNAHVNTQELIYSSSLEARRSIKSNAFQ
jgi:hypothetical protein